MREHGGRLREAAREWSIPLDHWLDLSTGIAPWPYPARVPAAAWQRLPEDEDGLAEAAAGYYGHPHPLPLPGTQAALQWLPRLLPRGRTVLPAPTYGEYAPAWRAGGHEVVELPFAQCLDDETDADVLMLASPNNPDGAGVPAGRLRQLAVRQQQRGGWLVLDAAFADAVIDGSAAQLTTEAGTTLPRLVVLRSLGKFFGLAGARVGFCCAERGLNESLSEALGPWALAHPSREAARQALADREWQAGQRQRLATATRRLVERLADVGLSGQAVGNLFVYLPHPAADSIHHALARRGILVRRFATPPAVRFGLPADEPAWQRLADALAHWKRT